MSNTKIVAPFSAKLITYGTTLPIQEVTARLEERVNKDGSVRLLSQIRGAKTGEEITYVVNSITNGRDFLYFGELNHHKWLNTFRGTEDTPITIVYTIGNPLIAQELFRHDIRAACIVPFRLLVTAKCDGEGTNVTYHSRFSLVEGTQNPELERLLVNLEEKIDSLISEIIALS